MKITFIKIIILSLAVFFFSTCNDPIFFIIHEEIPVIPPLINGSPTNFAVFNNKMYVASGKNIYEYNGNSWYKWKELGSFVMGLAATNSSLYALYLDGSERKIKQFPSDTNLSLSNVQSIHAAGDNVLFASAGDNNDYTIYYKEDSVSTFKPISNTNSASILNGVAYDTVYYYLCTYSGIFCVRNDDIDTSSTKIDPASDDGFTGIISLTNEYCAAISRNGKLYQIKDAEKSESAKFSDERYSTGALAIWYKESTDYPTTPSLLLVGRREKYYSTSTGYTYGYVEVTLNTTTGGISGSSFSDPGKNSLSSVNNNDRYVSSLGKKPVNHIIQTPADINTNMTLFASTQQNGVWSYRNRNDGNDTYWNAEN
jgi:hypothetical protein